MHIIQLFDRSQQNSKHTANEYYVQHNRCLHSLSAMEKIEDSTRDSSGVDDFDLMCVVAHQAILNNNVVLMRFLLQ